MKLEELKKDAVRSSNKVERLKTVSEEELKTVSGGHAHYHYPAVEN